MEQFKIHITFEPSGGPLAWNGTIEEHDNSTLTQALQRLLTGPAMRLGLYKEIKVVDQCDCTNLLWNNVDGLVFPTQEHMQEVSHG